MKVEISYFPPEEIITKPGPEATYPFEITGEFKYIVEFSCYVDGDYAEAHEEFFCKWMESPNYYPIYSLAEIYDFQLEEYEELFKKQNIEFNYMKGSSKDSFFVKANIRSPQQFKQYYPYLHGNGSMLNLSLWSLKQDVFRLEEREHESPYPVKRTKNNRTRLIKLKWIANTLIATLNESSTMFWVGYDGDYIATFSNDENFSTIDSLQKIMPEKVELVTDYEWE
ncbi:hypothetical protein QNH26_22340 [Peribacillus frigoritolerans]|uniref:hypothetical protein n=1 Tax=Peribacillus frigoritolerans TaxID=450367 RepID=UPI0024C0EEBC|nr:hypothetical protein [Peribacillus frigoritolerans]WHX66362.1 hypothetical protein QNH26_22340 [Peribacillus frigoritolerans]